MTTLPPDFYYSLTLCITMLGLMTVMYWYHKTITPFTGLKDFEGIETLDHESNKFFKQTLRLLIVEFDHKPLAWVSIIHTMFTVIVITINAIVDFSLTLSLVLAVSAITTYTIIITKRLRMFKSTIQDAKHIADNVEQNTFGMALHYIKQYSNIKAQNVINLGYLKDHPEFVYALLHAFNESLDDDDIKVEMTRFVITYKMTPLDALNYYEWPNTMRNVLVSLL